MIAPFLDVIETAYLQLFLWIRRLSVHLNGGRVRLTGRSLFVLIGPVRQIGKHVQAGTRPSCDVAVSKGICEKDAAGVALG